MRGFKSFRQEAESCGGTALSWNQWHFIGQQTFGRGGVCAPLVAKWIKDRRLRINFKTDMKLHEAREEIMQLKFNQLARPGTYLADYLRLVGLRQVSMTVLTGQTAKWPECLSEGLGYYAIGLASPVGAHAMSGHALAADLVHFKCFDPNFGQAAFSHPGMVQRFLAQWTRAVYPHLQHHALVERFL